jgi:hypothetical protein
VELWRGTVEVGPRERRRLVVTDSSIEVSDPNGVMPPVRVDLRAAASNGVLLVFSTTMNVVQGRGPDAKRLQLRAIAPPTFDGIDWPDDVAEAIEAQRERDREASLALRRQLGRLVAITISVLGVLLLVLVVVLLLA